MFRRINPLPIFGLVFGATILIGSHSEVLAHPCDHLPPRDCTSDCARLLLFEPMVGLGYDKYLFDSETENNRYRSYLRRDLSMLIKHAAAVVHCKAASWNWGNHNPIGFGDMSEASGAIPGTSIGKPAHPKGSHTNGYDVDIGYYQLTGLNNHLRPVCAEADNHCASPPNNLDHWRTALFIGTILTSDRTRVVGVDGQIGPVLIRALDGLCRGVPGVPQLAQRQLPKLACERKGMIAFEVTNTNKGWFYFHHHHFHVSTIPSSSRSFAPGNRRMMEEIELLKYEPHARTHK